MTLNNVKHFNFDKRIVIANGIGKGLKLKEIAELIGADSTSVSKEVKRNGIRLYPIHNPSLNLKVCSEHDRFPYVCNVCKHRCMYLSQFWLIQHLKTD
ncbi:MAG: helix-turn-helix domain-containing protein [Firmicutes bacterium]|nr:helix-turn-helix domain-containing protein [Candidatus Colivicinus equi]